MRGSHAASRPRNSRWPISALSRSGATRFFATPAAPREAIDDLCDFLLARLVDDPGFSLKGRTLRSLGALEREWRESLMIVRRFGEARWTGEPVADWVA